jgi:hypothetical protein
MALPRVKYDKRSGLAVQGRSGSVDPDPARNHLYDRALADVMIAHLLSVAKVDHHDPTLGRREQDTRILVTDRGHAWRISSRLARDALL